MIQIALFDCARLAGGSKWSGKIDIREPVHSLVDTFAIDHGARNDAPISISQLTKF